LTRKLSVSFVRFSCAASDDGTDRRFPSIKASTLIVPKYILWRNISL
jgi:hypothetical protein